MSNALAKDLSGRLERALELLKAGKRDQAVRAADGLVGTAKARLGERHPVVEEALRHASDFHEAAGNLVEAERLQREALAIRRFFVGEKDVQLVPSLTRLAALNLSLDRHALAEPLVRESIDICRQQGERGSAVVAIPLRTLAEVQIADDRPSDALESVRESCDAAKGIEDPRARKDITACALRVEARAARRLGDLDRAERAVREASSLLRELQGEGAPDVVNVQGELAEVLAELGDLEEADALRVRSAEAVRAVVGEVSGAFFAAVLELAEVRALRGMGDDAARLAAACDRISELVADGPGADAVMRGHLFGLHAARGAVRAGAQRLERAAAALRAEGRAATPLLSLHLGHAAIAAAGLGREEEAVALAKEAVAAARASERDSDTVLDTALEHLASVSLAAGNAHGALEAARDLVALRERVDGRGSVGAALAALHLAAALDQSRQDAESLAAAEGARASLSVLLGADHPLTAEADAALAWRLARDGRWFEAADMVARSLDDHARASLRLHAFSAGAAWDFTDHPRSIDLALAIALNDTAAAWVGLAAALRAEPLWPAALGAGRGASLGARAPEHAAKASHLRRTHAQLAEIEREPRARLAADTAPRRRLLAGDEARERAALEAAAHEHLWTETGFRHGPDAYLAALGKDEALIAIVRHHPPTFARRPAPRYARPRYVRAIIGGGTSHLEDVGPCDQIDCALLAGGDAVDEAARRAFGLPAHLRGARTLWIAPVAGLSEADLPRLAARATGLRSSDVRLAASPRGVLPLGPPLVRAAADEPLAVAAPDLDQPEPPRPAPIIDPPHEPTWWRRALERIGLVGPPAPAPIRVALDPPSFIDLPAPRALIADRDAAGPSTFPSWAAQVKLLTGGAATTAAVLRLKSPRWFAVAAPWGLLTDAWPRPEYDSMASGYGGVPPPDDPAPAWPLNPLYAAGIYLGAGGRGARVRGPVLTPRAICDMDLSQTAVVLLATPPRTPGRGPVGQARMALVRSFQWAGARCVVAPRTAAPADQVAAAAASLVERLAAGDDAAPAIAAWATEHAPGVLDVYEQR